MTPSEKLDTSPNIAIVGGGIGGLCTAIGLLNHGITTTIYEAAVAFSEIGAGVSLAPNAVNAMKLLDERIYQGYEKVKTNNGWPDHQQLWFTFRQGDDPAHDDGKAFYNMPCSSGQTSVHRAKFLDELIALIPPSVPKFKKRLIDIQESSTSVTLHFSDGTTATHSAVICADGIKSISRPIVLGSSNYPATYTGKYAYRGLIPMSLAIHTIGPELAPNSQQYLGHGSHILTYPIDNGKTLNVVAVTTSLDSTWPDDTNWIQPSTQHSLLSDFKNFSSTPRKILYMISSDKPVEKWALYDHFPPASTYLSKNNLICLLGDAAHASTPHNGNGAAMAIEDALIISHCLGCFGGDTKKAFREYEKSRYERTQRQVRTAREMGGVYEFQDSEAGDDLEKVKKKLEGSKVWLWEYDFVGEMERIEGDAEANRNDSSSL